MLDFIYAQDSIKRWNAIEAYLLQLASNSNKLLLMIMNHPPLIMNFVILNHE